MSELEYKTPGPWDDEPDADDFEACGLKCAMRRHVDDGHWCGYVGVPKDHAFFGKDKFWASNLHVHGGLVYCGTGDWAGFAGRWWFGFHCGHLRDLSPGLDDRYRDPSETYRDYHFARAECERLAAGLSAFGEIAHRLDDLMEKLMDKNQ